MLAAVRENGAEAVKVATLLLNRGIDVNVTRPDGATALTFAAHFGQPDVVMLLLARGADVRAQTNGGSTALHYACGNGVFGREMIPILCAAGADVMAKNKRGYSAVARALGQSGAMAEPLAPYVPARYKVDEFHVASHNPIGCLTVRQIVKVGLLRAVDAAASHHWRHGVSFAVSSGQPDTAPRAGSADRPQVAYRNPLVPNCRNELCVELTSDASLKEALRSYMCWQPHKLAMDWFGPCFRPRT